MANCEKLAACPFFNNKMAAIPALAEAMKQKYCRGDMSQCARYKVAQALGKEKVPGDLYPGQSERADALIGKGKG